MNRKTRSVIGCMLSCAAVMLVAACVPTENTRTDSLLGTGVSIGGLRIPTSAFSGVSGQSGTTGTDAAGKDYALTASERRMREQGRKFDKTVWQGALIGAAGGALWGVIKGDDTKDIFKKAAIGAAAGGLAGAYIAHKQRQYSNKEDQLESMIVDVRKSNTESKELIASAREVIAEDKRRLAAVESRYKQGAATSKDLQHERVRLADNRKVVKNAVTGAKKKQSMFSGAKKEFEQQNPDVDTQRFQSALETYNEHIDTLDGLAEGIAVA